MPTNFDVLARIAGVLITVLVFGVALMFSVVFVAVFAVAALVFWVGWRWKTRSLRRVMRERAGRFESRFGDPRETKAKGTNIIEGEAVRVDERPNR